MKENFTQFITDYNNLVQERAAEGIPPLALNTTQTQQVIEILQSADDTHKVFCKDLLANRINPGVDDSAKLKAEFLGAIAMDKAQCSVITPLEMSVFGLCNASTRKGTL